MHFLFFSAQYLPTIGGVERYTQNLAKTLVKKGHLATVVTSALPNLPLQETDEDGIRIFRLPSHLLMNGRFPIISKNRTFKRISDIIWQTKYDFAVINTRFYTLSIWAAKQCHRHGVPAIVLEHGTKHLSLDNPLLNIAGGAYEHTAMKLVRRYCDNFYGVSKACNDWLLHFNVTARGVLYNAVDADILNNIAEDTSFCIREKLSLPNDAPIISFIGRFIVEKGIWELLASFELLQKTLPCAILVMGGDGPLLDEVRSRNIPGVHVLGALAHRHCLALMRQSDVFCLPTYSEGFSNTILEAAALSSCIVTTPTGGSPELIENNVGGILLSNLSHDTIANALSACLLDSDLRQKMGAEVYQRVTDRFVWSATAERLIDISSQQEAIFS